MIADFQEPITSVGAVIVGSIIGQTYDGTTYPLAFGYLAIGVAVLCVVYFTEGRRLFQARHASGAQNSVHD